MGEQLGGGGLSGRRRAHPDGAVAGPWGTGGSAALESALAAAIRVTHIDPAAEQRAVAAFRAARDAGEHKARTRRRDDWRSGERRRTGRPLRATFAVAFASLALGGVAVAAIGSASSSSDGDGDGRGAARPSVGAPGPAGGTPSSAPSTGSGRPDHPATAQDIQAHCRDYERVKDRGRALDATAWQRLVAAAGGESKVDAYCSRQLAGATAQRTRGDDGNGGTSGAAGGSAGKGSGNAGNGDTRNPTRSGTGTGGGTGSASGSGQGSGRKPGGKSK